MIRLDYRDARPIYEQVKDGLRRLMVTGVLAPGEKLPSVRSLAMDLAINPNTIQRAYAQLEMEGYVYSVAGRGTFVAEGQEQNLVRRREVFVDGSGVGEVGAVVLNDRKLLAEDGMVVVVLSMSSHDHRLLCEPEIVTRGFVYVKESEELLQELRELGMTEGEWIALWRGGNENA